MKRHHDSLRGSALPTVMIIVVVVGIYAATLPSVSTGLNVRQANVQNERIVYNSAMSALEMGKALMYYETILEWRNFAGQTLDLESHGYDTINGAEVSVEVQELTPGVPSITYRLVATAQRHGTEVVVAEHVTVRSAAHYNFANSMFNDTGYLATRHWYGNTLLTSPDNELWGIAWWINATLNFHDTLESIPFTYGDSFKNHELIHFWDGQDELTHQEAKDVGKHTEYPDHESMPKVGSDLAIKEQLYPIDDGEGTPPEEQLNMWGEAARNGTLIKTDHPRYGDVTNSNADPNDPRNAGVEIFLSPNGEIWTRPLGGENEMGGEMGWQVMTDDNGQPVDQHGATIVVEGNALVRGFNTGSMSIGADTIVINGNIENMDPTVAHLGLVAQDAVFFENRQVDVEWGQGNDPDKGTIVSLPTLTENSSTQDDGDIVESATIPPHNPDTSQSLNHWQTDETVEIDLAHMNYLAKPVLNTNEWNSLREGNTGYANPDAVYEMFGPGMDMQTFNDLVMPSMIQYHQRYDNSTYPGVLPRDGAMVHASIVSGLAMRPALTHHSPLWNTYAWNTHGGDFTVRGTYAFNMSIDQMATWSQGGGAMNYDVHPYQMETAPLYFVPVTSDYPRPLPGTWQLVSITHNLDD